jgi:HAD superfamily hydrolase (TIGR01458 family)
VIEGLLLDIDGVLVISWEALPGSVEALERLRADGVPFVLITNTTTHTRADLAAILGGAGFDVPADRIVTAVTATASYLRAHHAGEAVFVLTDGDPGEDLEGVDRVDAPEDAGVMVLGGACDDFTYDLVTRVFRRLMDGARLVGMHRNLYWRTERGWELDSGAYIAGLEQAAGIEATICGKPSPEYFQAALDLLEVPAASAAMVGDDISNDVLGAMDSGLTGILVRTGKFKDGDLAKGEPDVVLDSLADVPSWLARRGPQPA